jgi:hypothetical protein
MASYGQYKDIPSPSPSLSSNTSSKHDPVAFNRVGVTGVGGLNRSNNVTATLRKSSITSKSPRGIGVHSPLPPMIGGTSNHNGLGQGGSSNINQLQNPSAYNHSTTNSANSSSPSSSLSNLTGALSKRFTVRKWIPLMCVWVEKTFVQTCLKLINDRFLSNDFVTSQFYGVVYHRRQIIRTLIS